MDVHERIRRALDLEEPDRVPTFSQSNEQPFIERLDEQEGIPDELCDAMFPDLTLDLVVAKALGNRQEETWDILREGGVHVVTDVATEKAVGRLVDILGTEGA